jgi:hypothetical protein
MDVGSPWTFPTLATSVDCRCTDVLASVSHSGGAGLGPPGEDALNVLALDRAPDERA